MSFIGSGAAVQSVSRCLLVVKRAILLFHHGMKKNATLESSDQRMKLFVSSTKQEERYLCGPRLLSTFDPEGDAFRYFRDNLTDVQLETADGSGALMIVKTIRLSVGPNSTQEAVRLLLLDFFRLNSLRRNYGETMRHWTRRFTPQYSKVGQALNASNAEISKDFLHESIRGNFLAETSGLTSSEFAFVLATSGTSSAAGEFIGNSRKFAHLVEAFRTRWGDAALAARETKARKSEAVVAAVGKFDLSGQSEAASRIENAISWNDADHQINEYEDDDDEYCEEDVCDTYTCDCDDELDETAYTVGTPTDDPELLEQFDGNLEDADVSASQVYVSASRSFQEERELLSRVNSARGYFPVVGIGAFDGLAQPSTDRKPAKSRGTGKKGKRKGQSSSQKGGKPTNQGTNGILPKPLTSRSESRPPMSKKRPTGVGATRGGPHHAPRLRPDECMFCRQVGHRASECPNKGKTTAFSPGNRAFGTSALGCAVFDALCYGAALDETKQDQDENDIEDFVAFSSRSLEEFAILGSHEDRFWVHEYPKVADQCEDTTIETTVDGFTFAGGETEAASTKI